MATNKVRVSSFSRSSLGGPASQVPGLKPGPNGSVFVSSGIPDLDRELRILGGGFCLGSLVMVMEDPEAPHHMLLLRNFMAQGLVHKQPLLYASPSKDPEGFLGTLPNPFSPKDNKPPEHPTEQEERLRISWQYLKYFGNNQSVYGNGDSKHEYCNDFDVRKSLEKQFLVGTHIDCVSLEECPLDSLRERCSSFLEQNSRGGTSVSCAGRIAIQSLCAPQCEFFDKDWDMLAFIKSLKDEDKELANLLTGYQEMVGLLSIHKVARFNTQVPLVLETSTFSIKLYKRKSLTLECLNQAPVDGASGASYGTSSSCSSSAKQGSLDF
ncbi:hypothetical protein KSS87_007827 [Heliosperma pusillum]|nr:hypothetical protein KSS87_007827 [Heliosperma pusillum]